MNKKNIFYIVILTIGLVFLANGFILAAWTSPSQSPPNGNVDTPINVGSTEQSKAGRLGISTSDADNSYGLTIGTNNTYGLKSDNTSWIAGWSIMNDVLWEDGEEIVRAQDEWLRLNGGSDFASGIYTPGVFRSDGGYQTNGMWTISANGARFYPYNNVASDQSQGLYFNGASTAYAIYRESGSWSSPYPDLRIAFHTGIKLGAHSSYNGIRFYTDYDMGSLVMSVNDGSTGGPGNVYMSGDLIVDGSMNVGSDDIEDNSINSAKLNVCNGVCGFADSGNDYIRMKSNNNGIFDISFYDWSDTKHGALHGFNFGQGFGLIDGDGDYSYLAVKDEYTSFKINDSEKMRIVSSGVRADTFSDINDTSYYVNPNATSRLDKIEITNLGFEGVLLGNVCMFFGSCPVGWTDRGGAGFLFNEAEGDCPFVVGGRHSGNWYWCHPRLCCN